MPNAPALLSAKPVAEKIRSCIQEETSLFVREFRRKPKLSVVLVGEDPASVIYTRKKGEAAVQTGMDHETIRFPASASPAEVRAAVQRLNEDPGVDGILIQRPLPAGFREDEVLFWVAPEKDVDAFHPENTGRLSLGLPCFQPCTPAGVMALLAHYGISPAGKIACVVGRSPIVGKPMAALLLQANATVIQCHRQTPDPKSLASQADILVVAAGIPGLVDQTWVKPGAVVVDVGIHRNESGQLVGDVQFESVASRVSAITPVPGGVGPMTITLLLENTLRAARQRQAKG